MKRYSIILTLLVTACSASSSLYDSEIMLTTQRATAQTTDLSVAVPADWFSSLANDEEFIDLWLIKEDYSATISFNPIHFSKNKNGRIKVDELDRILLLLKTSAKTNGNILTGRQEEWEIHNRSFKSFEYVNNKNEVCRKVIFGFDTGYYECTAIPTPHVNNTHIEIDELFSTQNSILFTIAQ